jgi:hypothetical protein
MAILRAGIAAALAASGTWLTVQLVNRPDRWQWLSRMMQPLPLKLAVGYFVICAVTLPFLDTLWLGEFPVLALIQLPKVALAKWCQHELVMKGSRVRDHFSFALIESFPTTVSSSPNRVEK